jgi:hypothetical protein
VSEGQTGNPNKQKSKKNKNAGNPNKKQFLFGLSTQKIQNR